MSEDIFKGCFGIGWIIIFIFIIIGIILPEQHRNHINVLFFFVIGGLCLYNFNSCGRIHCQITGWGFIGVGIIALLEVFNIISISFNIIWAIFVVVLVVGYGYEFLQKEKTGSCYSK